MPQRRFGHKKGIAHTFPNLAFSSFPGPRAISSAVFAGAETVLDDAVLTELASLRPVGR